MCEAKEVGCFCGWRGKRKPGTCACYDEYALYCNCLWGVCPKCGSKVWDVEYIQEVKERFPGLW